PLLQALLVNGFLQQHEEVSRPLGVVGAEHRRRQLRDVADVLALRRKVGLYDLFGAAGIDLVEVEYQPFATARLGHPGARLVVERAGELPIEQAVGARGVVYQQVAERSQGVGLLGVAGDLRYVRVRRGRKDASVLDEGLRQW